MPIWKELTEEKLIFTPEARIEYKRYCADCHVKDPPVDTPAGMGYTTSDALPENGKMYDGVCPDCEEKRRAKIAEWEYLGDRLQK